MELISSMALIRPSEKLRIHEQEAMLTQQLHQYALEELSSH
jgi:hypothetical protein